MAEKKSKTAKPKTLPLEEAAEFLGISPLELNRSRYRGMAPGKLAFKKDGVLVWNVTDLEAHVAPVDEDDNSDE